MEPKTYCLLLEKEGGDSGQVAPTNIKAPNQILNHPRRDTKREESFGNL